MAFKVRPWEPRSPSQSPRDSQEHILKDVPGIILLPHSQRAQQQIPIYSSLDKRGRTHQEGTLVGAIFAPLLSSARSRRSRRSRLRMTDDAAWAVCTLRKLAQNSRLYGAPGGT